MVKKDAKSTQHSRYSDSKIVLNQEQHHHNYIYNNKNNNNSKQIHSQRVFWFFFFFAPAESPLHPHTHTQMTQHPPIMVPICFSIASLFLELSSFPTVSFFLLSLSKILHKKNVCWIFQVKTIKVFLIHCHWLNSHTKVRTSIHSSKQSLKKV